MANVEPESIDAVWISHGHPDHCADLQPLLRARVFAASPPAALPVYAPGGSLDRLLAIDAPGLIDDAYELHTVADGDEFSLGPFRLRAQHLPHSMANLGVRISSGGTVLAYTGDTGPRPAIAEYAQGVSLLIADSTFADVVPEQSAAFLSSATQAGQNAHDSAAGELLLTHLRPGSDPEAALDAASKRFGGPISVAAPGVVFDLG